MEIVKFCAARVSESIICFLAIGLLPMPPDMDFTGYSVPAYLPLEGSLKPNEKLNNAEHLFEGLVRGPESFDIYKGELYTGLHGGHVVKIANNNIVPVVKFGQPCDGYLEEKVCGRPLGLKFDKNGNLFVADAYYGIFKYNVETGVTTKLVSPDIPIDDKKPALINSVDIARDGTVYWTDSTSEVTLEDGLYTVFGDPSGRLFRYNPSTNSSEVLLEKLHFANGVVLSPEEDFVLVAETHLSRIQRYYLKGPKKGTSDIFVDRLPGIPDNLSKDGKGGYFVPLVAAADNEHPLFFHVISGHPLLRRFIRNVMSLVEMPFYLIERFFPNYYTKQVVHWIGHFESVKWLAINRFTLLRLGRDGKILESFHCLDGSLGSISDIAIFEDAFYFGSPFNTYVGRVKFEKTPKISVRVKTIKEPQVELKY